MDEQVTQYLRRDSWLFWTTVQEFMYVSHPPAGLKYDEVEHLMNTFPSFITARARALQRRLVRGSIVCDMG